MNELNINISGDFIDSYIYSGVLFTVDTHGRLCSYSWQTLVEKYFSIYPQHSKFKKKIIDCRKNENDLPSEKITLFFDKDFLEKNQKGTCCDLNVWSTDLDVKDNILYISSERGLETLPFMKEWNNGKVMKFNDLIPLWKEAKVFGLSTGTWGRTIFAAGENGAIEIINDRVEQLIKLGFSSKKEKIINDNLCLDCEWNKDSTLAILDGFNKDAILSFKKIPGEDTFRTERNNHSKPEKTDEEQINKIKKQLTTDEATNIKNDDLQHSWFEDRTLYAINSENKKFTFIRNKWEEVSNWKLNEIENPISKIKTIETGSFIETNSEELFIFKGESKHLLAEEFTSWRVFPRSKNYQDRVHVVNDDHLQIKIFS